MNPSIPANLDHLLYTFDRQTALTKREIDECDERKTNLAADLDKITKSRAITAELCERAHHALMRLYQEPMTTAVRARLSGDWDVGFKIILEQRKAPSLEEAIWYHELVKRGTVDPWRDIDTHTITEHEIS